MKKKTWSNNSEISNDKNVYTITFQPKLEKKNNSYILIKIPSALLSIHNQDRIFFQNIIDMEESLANLRTE